MRANVPRICLICCICIISVFVSLAATSAQRRPRVPTNRPAAGQVPTPTPETNSEAPPYEQSHQTETLKINTSLVTVPVIAANLDGIYVADMQQNELNITEDGVRQEVAFFASVSAPFHVVMVLDTSASTQTKLRLIQHAATAFVEQLQSGDRVKVISFDDRVRELSEFTNDRAILQRAIYSATSGQSTKLYDAFELALSSIRSIQGRKAIVLFSDGVDWHSDQASFASTLHWLEEEGVIVYPIRYDTREETERIARAQAEEQSPQLPTIGVIRTPPAGTTAPTFPSDNPDSVPTSGQSSRTGPFGLPLPAEILRRRRDTDPNTGRLPPPDRLPPSNDPGDRRDRRDAPGTLPPPGSSRRGQPHPDDSITAMMDQLYLTADSYLNELANKSGGRILRADTLSSLPEAFAKIAAELRTQYAIGYYPTNKERDGQYRKLKVTTTRKNVVIRARPGYRAPSGG
ncbi:MAG: VWA domain-containing protein [Pyrinomonadaceae bacterium]